MNQDLPLALPNMAHSQRTPTTPLAVTVGFVAPTLETADLTMVLAAEAAAEAVVRTVLLMLVAKEENASDLRMWRL